MLLHKSVLRLLAAASNDAGRYELNGIYVNETDNAIEATATSGKILAKIRHEKKDDEELPSAGITMGNEEKRFTIASSVIKKIVKLLPKTSIKPILSFFRVRAEMENLVAEIVDNDLDIIAVKSQPVNGLFPDNKVSQVVDSALRDADVKMLIDPEILLKATKLMIDLQKDLDVQDGFVEMLLPRDGKTPIILQFHSKIHNATAQVMVMPIVKSK